MIRINEGALGLLFLALMVLVICLGRYFQRNKAPPDPLDWPLFWWTPSDCWSVRDLLRSLVIIGQTGSGKSSSSGKQLDRAIINYDNSGGLILASKPEDKEFFRSLFAEAGRSDDLLIFGPNSPLRTNVLDFEQAAGADAMDIVKMMFVLSETLQGGEPSSSQESLFWREQAEQQLFCAVLVCKLAYGKVSAPDLLRFLTTAPTSPLVFRQEKDIPEDQPGLRAAARIWQAGFHSKTLEAAFNAPKTTIETHDFAVARDFWTNTYPNRDSKLRGSVDAQIMGVLNVMCVGQVRELLSTTTNVSPADMEKRKFIFIDMPSAGKGAAEVFTLAAWKWITQRHILRRQVKPGDAIIVIHGDECQKIINSADVDFLAMCRSHYGCLFYLTQSLHSFGGNLKDKAGKAKAQELLSNFFVKVMMTIGDAETANWASGLCGQLRETFVNVSIAPPEDLYDELFSGKHGITTSISEQYQPTLKQADLLAGGRCGGKANGLICDGYVIRSGEFFSNGRNFLRVAFSQK